MSSPNRTPRWRLGKTEKTHHMHSNSDTNISHGSHHASPRVPEWLLGTNPAIRRISEHVSRAAQVECAVLLAGETGTGKEIWARNLHDAGPRRDQPFIPVNCAALTSTLAESQLFGHAKGAFTGALGPSLGVFRAAEKGIVFLDEVGEMPQELQPKLLRVLQQAEVTPVGEARPVPIDVQVIAATNRDLEREVEAGRFREDLYFRLNLVELKIPALRERTEDIPLFMQFFAERFAEKYNRERWEPKESDILEFQNFTWPGNIRQLSHVIEQAYVLDCQPTLPSARTSNIDRTLPFLDLGRLRNAAVTQALRTTRGHKGRAAKLLGVHANTLTRLLAQMRDEPTEE